MIIIKKAYLLSMADINYEYRDILIDKGKIIKIAKSINPDDYKDALVIKAVGRYVTPGLIDAHTHLGILEEIIKEGSDVNEMSNPITPALRAIDGINPNDSGFDEALKSGVTTVSIGPGSANLIGGTFTILKLREGSLENKILVTESAMKMALGENPKRVYGSQNKAPITRMASASLIRETLIKAKNYHDEYHQYLLDIEKGLDKKFTYDHNLASLMRVFDGMPVKIHAHRADDICTAIRIMEEFDLNYTIEHATEGYMIPETLEKHHVRCNIGPTLSSKSKPELANKSFESGRILAEHKIPFSIITDHPVIELDNMLLQVGRFVRAGLNELTALKAVTISAAESLGIEKETGSIEVGKDADIVIWSHHPFHYLAAPKCIIIDGKIMYRK